jgi:hypothetical protein
MGRSFLSVLKSLAIERALRSRRRRYSTVCSAGQAGYGRPAQGVSRDEF